MSLTVNLERPSPLRINTSSHGSAQITRNDITVTEPRDHDELNGRDAADQHPISAITGLQDALDSKQDNLSLKTINGESLIGAGDIKTLNVAVNGGGSMVFFYGSTV